ncbi:hypothetical protein GOFOIKOB_3967 [Methylobacterium tardum]|jgi:hypothetical protein|uniref:Uncharacterized protein n=1 Tax=Methylobacterium tardum TaxID=374432 RepID=A0AA37WTT0_9HYPH|nr:hypothetical protein [Methylobacterium tardum]URD37972.1 hypothetical protein M6G65_05620 [Methylobacterium tardum]GJE50913.1 hypothetical protein GOFOIKOB_3967 [Methylobacterium tardum]GLS70258.1 hypothetical protein GCM10007890_22710 [Methylobacterium tardum]
MNDDPNTPSKSLPEPVRDHLGQQLRGVLPVEADKPRFLGDDPVPEVFEPQIRRLETRLKTHEEGTGAVGQALDQILDAFGVRPEDTDKRAG